MLFRSDPPIPVPKELETYLAYLDKRKECILTLAINMETRDDFDDFKGKMYSTLLEMGVNIEVIQDDDESRVITHILSHIVDIHCNNRGWFLESKINALIMKEEMLQKGEVMQKKMDDDVGNKQRIDKVFATEETVKSPEVKQAEAEWQQWVSDEITDMMSSMSDE